MLKYNFGLKQNTEKNVKMRDFLKDVSFSFSKYLFYTRKYLLVFFNVEIISTDDQNIFFYKNITFFIL